LVIDIQPITMTTRSKNDFLKETWRLLSAGQAAEMAGISKRAFVELPGRYGVSLFSRSIEDLQKDIANACKNG